MTEVILTDANGRTLRAGIDVGGIVIPEVYMDLKKSKSIFDDLPNLQFKDDDVMLCTFPKSGTNWVYEILSMINNRSAERIASYKFLSTIESQTKVSVDALSSSRVLNSHLRPSRVRQIYGLPTRLGESDNQGLRFSTAIVYYEDLKLDTEKELNKLLQFLDVSLDKTLKERIISACSFEKMATEKEIVPKEQREDILREGFNFFRKGKIGDWKNEFTVAQNDLFEEIRKTEMKDSKIYNFT